MAGDDSAYTQTDSHTVIPITSGNTTFFSYQGLSSKNGLIEENVSYCVGFEKVISSALTQTLLPQSQEIYWAGKNRSLVIKITCNTCRLLLGGIYCLMNHTHPWVIMPLSILTYRRTYYIT